MNALDSSVLAIIGSGYLCNLLEGNPTIFEIKLGFRPTIYPGDLLKFKSGNV